jgi:hypothetical protein
MPNEISTLVEHIFRIKYSLSFLCFFLIISNFPVSLRHLVYSYPRNRPWRPIGLWDVKDPTLSRQSAQMAVRLSALRASRDLLPRNINLLLLELISVTGWVHPRALYGMKDYVSWTFIHYKGPWTRDLPAGIIKPYPLPYRAPQCMCVLMVTKKSNLIRKGINHFLYKVSVFLVKGE